MTDPIQTIRETVEGLLPTVTDFAADLYPDAEPLKTNMGRLRDSLRKMRCVLDGQFNAASKAAEPLPSPTRRLVEAGANLCHVLESVTAGDDDSPTGRQWSAAIAGMRQALRQVEMRDVKAEQREQEEAAAAARAKTEVFFEATAKPQKPVAFHSPTDGLC